MASSPIVYDKAKYHMESVEQEGLDEDQTFVHTAFYLRWILEHKLYSEEFKEDAKEQISLFESGKFSALKMYQYWDGCLIDDMLSEEGNAFTQHYFDFENGRYLQDYEAVTKDLPSMFKVEFNDDNYLILKPRIEEAYATWKSLARDTGAPSNASKPWWKVW